jgi:biopolymer transport protein ExbD
MIDVVFLLMVFFIITLDPDDIMASIPVSRPAPPKDEFKIEKEPPALRLTVTRDQYLVDGKIVDLDYVDWFLHTKYRKLGADDALILCEGDADHGRLIRAMDIFMKNDVTNLSLMSK